MQHPDAEIPLADKGRGYQRTAQLMAKYDEFAIFRRFKRHNYQNILYLQAQVIHLGEELEQLACRDATHADRKSYGSEWWALSHGMGREGKEQWEKVKALRAALERYSMTNSHIVNVRLTTHSRRRPLQAGVLCQDGPP